MVTETQTIVTDNEELASLIPSKRLDTRGLVCPYPAFETSKLASSASDEDVLDIISDDEYVATSSIPTVLKVRNFEYAVLKLGDGTFSIRAKRAGGDVTLKRW
jgi:TusA-related sulfurtransferase